MALRLPFLALLLVFFSVSFGQPYNPAIDVQNYEFALRVSDTSDMIQGTAFIHITGIANS